MNKLIETLLAPNLDPAKAEPLAGQLMSALQGAILAGNLVPGVRLPASRTLASRLAISRNTVLAAYDQLIAEGYLESRKGAGTYVCADLPDGYLKTPPPDAPKLISKPKSPRPLSGMPALDQFPFALWGRLAGSIWRHADTDHLQHMDPAGYKPLREAIAAYLKAARGVQATADQILITNGLQEGLRLVAECVIPQDAAVILEDPGYPGLRNTANQLPHPTVYTTVDQSGACAPTSRQLKGLMPGILLISPSRQYPLGMTMPVARRLELLEWAAQTGALILEDDYDSEFRYAGRPLQSMQGLDGGQHVIYGGSFSKSLFLSLRLGYLVLPSRLAAQVVRHRERTASFPPLSSQLILTRFIEEGHFARHLRRLRAVHKERLDAFFTHAQGALATYLALDPTEAGLHIVARPTESLASVVPDEELAALAHASGLGAVALSRTYGYRQAEQGLLLGFANVPVDDIPAVLTRFALALKKALDEKPLSIDAPA